MLKQKEMQNFRREEGITLIALIITIIILVILAAVSINAAYNSGIINYAVNGTQNYIEAAKKEQERISNAEGLTESVMGNLDKIQNSINAGERAGETKYYISSGKIAAVPAGFVVSKKADESSIANGLVIYGIPEDDTAGDEDNDLTDEEIAAIDWTSSSVTENLRTKYDQFVWIPVNLPYVTAKEITEIITAQGYTNETNLTANQKAINYLISQGKYPMAVQLDNGTDYRGILYNIANNGTISSYADFSLEANVSYETKWKTLQNQSDETVYAEYCREPGMVCYDFGIKYDSNATPQYSEITNPNTIELTMPKLQQEYNNRVKSVKTNGGFWVGRYETSGITGSTSDDNTASALKVIAGVTPSNNINWYRAYAQQKTYINGIDESYVGGMISGAEWDQMMIYLTKAGKDVNATTSVGHTESDFSNENRPYKTGGTNYEGVYSGSVNSGKYGDIWNNIYDLEGNVREWTIEAYNTDTRVDRGGSYYNAVSAKNRYSHRSNITGSGIGSRASLYIK